ncbi:TIGR00645 family protein [Marinicellulosiphila megalodicopiae]|uniref:TIGR00645 family protein n=1 Tax=Marinicellulosiphila megalodicopiae TaxID=2724896 RepID=UPI003CC81CDD
MIEKRFERLIYACRWVLAPIYLGLTVGLLLLGVKFFQEAYHFSLHLLDDSENQLILNILSMVDMALVGGLIVMVMFSGYENFVSSLDIDEGTEKLNWLGTLDAGSLKQKVAASIVAISSIHLLKTFMKIAESPTEDITIYQTQAMWLVLIHITFVVSALGMAWVDRINKH